MELFIYYSWLVLICCLYGSTVLYFLMTSKQNYITNYKNVSWGFLIAIIVAITLFHKYYVVYFYQFPFALVLILILFILLIFLLYNYLSKIKNKSISHYFEKRKMYFVAFEPQFVLPMSLNLIWQQLGMLFLFEFFKSMGLALPWIIIVFACIVAISHLYIFKNGKFLGYYFLIATFIAGLLFPIVITYIPGAVIYSYMFHWIFYLISGVIFYKLRESKLIFV